MEEMGRGEGGRRREARTLLSYEGCGLTFAPSDDRDPPRFGTDAEHDWFLDPGNEEMSPFP